MFGWVEYREDGKYRRKNGVENSVFHRLGMEGKSKEWKTGRNFSLPGPQNFSSQIGRKISEGKQAWLVFYQNTHPPTLIHTPHLPSWRLLPTNPLSLIFSSQLQTSSAPGSALFSFLFALYDLCKEYMCKIISLKWFCNSSQGL